MSHQDLINTIRRECQSAHGFLVKLRFHEFSQIQYETLIEALRQYREVIRGQLLIEREVAVCLYFLDLEMGAGLQYQFTEIDRLAYGRAQLGCSELIIEILTPEFMTEPT